MACIHLFDISQIRQVAVMRALPGLGDMLCIVPALRALRSFLPDARIDFIGLPIVKPIIDRFSRYIDGFIEFPGFPGIPERDPIVHELPDFFADMHYRRFDLALQMHGSGATSNTFTLLLGARTTAGFFLPSLYCPDPNHFLPYLSHESEVSRYIRLLEFLGVPSAGEELEFPLDNVDYASFELLSQAHGLQPSKYVCIHPGASLPSRRWAIENFAQVAHALFNQGLQIVLTGTELESEITHAVAQSMHVPAIDLAGQTHLGSLGVLLNHARLLVCNDTGVSHLGAALRVPSVVVFLASDPDRWAPLDEHLHRRVGRPAYHVAWPFWQDAVQLSCLLDSCGFLEVNLGMKGETATPDRVLKEADMLLSKVSRAA
jgi:ADP-heptose:LPS heptosyltransferase